MKQRDRPTALLGGLAPGRFLEDHWQKRPLLVRSAIEGFTGLLSPADLLALACRDDVESRVVIQRAQHWEVQHGPFEPRFFRRLPARGWTLLVQDVNHFLAQGGELLRRFAFIPYFRLDDLMVSYAPAGGGVGPHFDSYDVFLLQGLGRRRWRISNQRDLALIPDAPLKMLANFRPQQEWTLDAGDMLYLPPAWAHDGVAEDHCMTYSIGFRAPAWQELAGQFLAHLQDHLVLPGRYADPALQPAARPARLSRNLLHATLERFARIRWSRVEVARFLGSHLTEPKPHVFFRPPRRALSLHAFALRAVRTGIVLELKTQMLYDGSAVFINGDTVFANTGGSASRRLRTRLHELADARCLLPVHDDPAALFAQLHAWYRAGYLSLRGARRRL